MQAAILAGGLGTRLRPKTLRIAKVMIFINGKPCLLHLLELLKTYGVNDIVLCVGYLREQVEDFFKDGKKLGIRIRYSEEKEGLLLGTGGALKRAENLLDNYFFVINGDTYLPIDYREVAKLFKKRGKSALMVVYDNKEKSGVKNNVALDDDLMVVKHDKEKFDANLKYVDAGVLILCREVLNLIEEGRSVSLEKGLYPTLMQQRELAAYVTDQRFYDIGTPGQLRIFEELLKEKNGDDYHPHTL